MFELTPEARAIQNKIEGIALTLMRHENKNFCLAKISPFQWVKITYRDNNREDTFVIVPSLAFQRLIIYREYAKVVEKYPHLFGTGNDWNIVRAIKEFDKDKLLREYTDQEFLDYIRGETMAYVFKIEDEGTLSDRILRLDLCRNINPDNVFQGGIFHVFKHFTPKGFDTISSNNKEFDVETFSEIYRYVILNFFSDDFKKEKGNYYEAKSTLKDGHTLRGIYYKEDDIPVSFISSIRIDSRNEV